MNPKIIVEDMNNGYINLFKEWFFYRWYEYSAIWLNQLTTYKLMLDLYKKENKILLTCWFPENQLEKIEQLLQNKNIAYRIFEKDESKNKVFDWKNKIEINKQKLTEIKQKLIKF